MKIWTLFGAYLKASNVLELFTFKSFHNFKQKKLQFPACFFVFMDRAARHLPYYYLLLVASFGMVVDGARTIQCSS
jgi:hypothetical protein